MMRVGLLCVLLITLLAAAWLRGQREAAESAGKADVSLPQVAAPQPRAEPVAGPVQVGAAVQSGHGAPSPELRFATASANEHAAEPGQPCLAESSRKNPAQNTSLHRWVDEAGIVHFSDQAPMAGAREYRRIDVPGLPPVRVEARGVDVNLPDYVVQRASMDAQAIERVMRSSLAVAGDPGLELKIEFIASPEIYAQRIGDVAMAKSDGTYSSRDRTIRIRQKEETELNFQILRHELTHALVHEHIGSLPTTINEGLAGYFEHVEVSGLGARVVVDSSRRRPDASMSEDGQEELIDLLATEGVGFYGAGQELRYLRSKALIAMLMDRKEGRMALTRLLSAQREMPCQPVEAAPILDQAYPGGLRVLAGDWSRWLRNPTERAHAY